MRQSRAPRKYLLYALLATVAPIPLSRALNGPEIYFVTPQAEVTTPGSKVVVFGTEFSPDAVVYFGGLQTRETTFVSPSRLEVVTPYLRPGEHQLQVRSAGVVVRSNATFKALPSQVDSEMDRALAMAKGGQTSPALHILQTIAETNSDYQVRAFARYQTGQIYFDQGDWMRWAGVPIFLDAKRSGMAVQTSWRYRLARAEANYLLIRDGKPDTDLRIADFFDKFDVTENPEPRFYRSLLNARCGNLTKAKTDNDFILGVDPENPSYQALAAFIAALNEDRVQLSGFSSKARSLLKGGERADARALSLLGEAAYLSGDIEGAHGYWAEAGRAYPLGAGLAYLAGKKHLWRGDQRIAALLLRECVSMAPDSKEAKEALELVATFPESTQ